MFQASGPGPGEGEVIIIRSVNRGIIVEKGAVKCGLWSNWGYDWGQECEWYGLGRSGQSDLQHLQE